MQVEKRLRVAICGAGIAGLVCALGLSAYPDLEVNIYESASVLTEVGAGIGLWARAWDILRRLGLEQDLTKLLGEQRPNDGPLIAFQLRKSDQPRGTHFYSIMATGPMQSFHRAEFQQALLQKLSHSTACRLHYAKRLCTFKEASMGGVLLLFEDGSSDLCDVLIGADGIKSAVRKTLVEAEARLALSDRRFVDASRILEGIQPAWSGTVVYRSVVPIETLRARSPAHSALFNATLYLGKDAYIVGYPIRKGTHINVGAFITRHDMENTAYDGPWRAKGNKSEMMRYFSDWEQEAQVLIDCTEDLVKWPIHCARPLKTYVADRAVIIGDAAHAMLPHQGAGAGQAIEDAFALSLLLGNPRTTRQTLPEVLRVYDGIRRPISQDIARSSRLSGQLMSFHPPALENLEVDLDHVLAHIGNTMQEKMEWLWLSTVDNSMEDMMRKYDAQLAVTPKL